MIRARVAFFAVGVGLATAALAQPARSVAGVWGGSYTCPQGVTSMRLDLREGRGRAVEGVMTFYAHPENPGVPSGCFTMRGTFDAATGKLVLKQSRWISRPDVGWYMIDLEGKVDQNGYRGAVGFPISPGACTTFQVKQVQRTAPPQRNVCDGPALTS